MSTFFQFVQILRTLYPIVNKVYENSVKNVLLNLEIFSTNKNQDPEGQKQIFDYLNILLLYSRLLKTITANLNRLE